MFELTDKQKLARPLLVQPQPTHVFLRGGGRSGKTFLVLRALVFRCLVAPGSRHAVFRSRFNHLKHSVIFDTFPKMMRLCFPTLPYTVNKTDWYVSLPNGSSIVFGGLDEKDRTEKVLGQEYASIFLNEASQITYAARNKALTRLAQRVPRADRPGELLALKEYADANPPSVGHWTYKLFIKLQEPASGSTVSDPAEYGTLQMNPADNRANISPDYIAQLETLPEKDRRRFLHGEFLSAVDNALWTADQLDTCRVSRTQIPELRRVVVGVDPSGCEGPEDNRSDEIGIVVCGIDNRGTGYVLEDASGRYSPDGWARAALTMVDKWSADRIVAERNFGGAMVENTIRTTRRNAPIKLVTASRGKTQRAEPVAALYEAGRVRHLQTLPDIEEQLCYFSTAGFQGDRSPDRADAMIWALTELLVEPKKIFAVA